MNEDLMRDGAHIVFNEQGDMEVIHDGSLNISDLEGEVISSEKSTEVDFDPRTGDWFSILKDGREICRGKDRRRVVHEEHVILADMVSRGERIPKNNLWSAVVRAARLKLRKFFQ